MRSSSEQRLSHEDSSDSGFETGSNSEPSSRVSGYGPPLTLPILSALAARAGYEVEFLDTRFLLDAVDDVWVLDEAGLEMRILESSADVAAIRFMSSSAELGCRVARLCRAAGMTVGEAETLLPELLPNGCMQGHAGPGISCCGG